MLYIILLINLSYETLKTLQIARYDIRRMQYAGEPLVFISANHPYGQLNKATESYKVLWPVGSDVWTNDPLVEQTPGYETTKP